MAQREFVLQKAVFLLRVHPLQSGLRRATSAEQTFFSTLSWNLADNGTIEASRIFPEQKLAAQFTEAGRASQRSSKMTSLLMDLYWEIVMSWVLLQFQFLLAHSDIQPG